MGFASGEAVTSVDLKLRYSEMMKVVHPEKGFQVTRLPVQLWKYS